MILLKNGKGLGFGACVVAAFCGLNCLADLHGCKLSANGRKTEDMKMTYVNTLELTELCLSN
jgi:hypothetical protein